MCLGYNSISLGFSFVFFHSQRDLEYDPALYQRDRGELDWDARSVSSSNVLGDTKSIYAGSGRSSPAPSKILDYNRYLHQGPLSSQHPPSSGVIDNIEMTRFDGDEMPLLNTPQTPGYFDPAASRSTTSLPAYAAQDTSMGMGGMGMGREREVPPIPAMTPVYGSREAPVHRPSPDPYASSLYSQQPYATSASDMLLYTGEPSGSLYVPSPSPSPGIGGGEGGRGGGPLYEQNVAGRGTFRRY